MLKKIDWKTVIVTAVISTAFIVAIMKYTDFMNQDCQSAEPVPEE